PPPPPPATGPPRPSGAATPPGSPPGSPPSPAPWASWPSWPPNRSASRCSPPPGWTARPAWSGSASPTPASTAGSCWYGGLPPAPRPRAPSSPWPPNTRPRPRAAPDRPGQGPPARSRPGTIVLTATDPPATTSHAGTRDPPGAGNPGWSAVEPALSAAALHGPESGAAGPNPATREPCGPAGGAVGNA